ncbi:MAG: sigma-70 family RNA polymerase sigma factor [Clostridiales bacterium]|nr:sigma-70 family RNA polymerase sigma factor [Clostridiales bacterium]
MQGTKDGYLSADQRLTNMMQEYGQSLLHTCFLILHDAHAAEDAVQDTFLKAYRNLDRLRAASNEKAWLMTIAINTCRDYLRTAWLRRVDRRVPLDELPIAAPDSEPFDDTLTQAIMGLPRKLREALVIYYFHQITIAQTAEILGVTERVVGYRLKKAREALRDELKEWYYDEN